MLARWAGVADCLIAGKFIIFYRLVHESLLGFTCKLVSLIYAMTPLCLYAADSATFSLNVVSPLERVFYSRPMPSPGVGDVQVELWAAKNERESFQLAFHSDSKWKITKVEATDLVEQASGAVIGSDAFEYRFPGYIFLNNHTSKTPEYELDGNAPGWYPDPLEEEKSLEFSGTRSLWGEYYVGPDTKPGDYTGQLLIHHSGGVERIPVRLHVWNFVLPSTPSLYMSNWVHSRQIFSHFSFTKGRTGRFWAIVENIADDLAAHRQSVVRVPLNLITVRRAESGIYEFDFRDYERWIRIFLARGIKVFEGTSLFHGANSYDIRVRAGIDEKRVEFGESQLASAAGKTFLKKFLLRLHAKNKELNIADVYLQHVADEASPEKVALYREIAAIVRQAMPGVTIIDATELPRHMHAKMMDIPVTKAENRETVTDYGDAGLWGRWWYTSVTTRREYPNRFIDYPLIKMRIIPWITWRNGLSGYLHYGYNHWYVPSGGPLREDVEQGGNYPPGDGFIVYPARSSMGETIVSSLRWEAMREGMEDVEYLFQLDRWYGMRDSAAGQALGEQCRGLVNRTVVLRNKVRASIQGTRHYPRDNETLSALRLQIGAVLDKLSACEAH